MRHWPYRLLNGLLPRQEDTACTCQLDIGALHWCHTYLPKSMSRRLSIFERPTFLRSDRRFECEHALSQERQIPTQILPCHAGIYGQRNELAEIAFTCIEKSCSILGRSRQTPTPWQETDLRAAGKHHQLCFKCRRTFRCFETSSRSCTSTAVDPRLPSAISNLTSRDQSYRFSFRGLFVTTRVLWRCIYEAIRHVRSRGLSHPVHRYFTPQLCSLYGLDGYWKEDGATRAEESNHP